MKKFAKILFGLALLLCVPFALVACGGKGENNKNDIKNVYIKVDGNTSSSVSISEEYNPRLTLNSLYGRVMFVFEYKDGTRKDATEDNFSPAELAALTYSEEYYKGRGFDEQTGEHKGWDLISEDQIDDSAPINVGEYKIVFTIEGHKSTLEIFVSKASVYQKSVQIAIVNNDVTNYAGHYTNSSFKFGMPEHKEVYDENTYTSDVKAYVYDPELHRGISGAEVTKVYAMPQIAPEDYTFMWYDTIGGTMDVSEGDNLVDKYNAINVSDSGIKEMRRQQFLYHYGIEITTGRVRNDNTLVVYTETLRPGVYYTFANYADINHENTLTAPSKNSTLRVEKGDFDWKKTLHREGEDYDEEEATNFINSLSFNMTYMFDSSNPLFNTVDAHGNVVKAIPMDTMIRVPIIITSTYADWENQIKSDSFMGGSGAFAWVELALTGRDENNHIVTRLDSTDNGIKLKARLKLSEELKFYYEEDDTDYLVEVNILKGRVDKPILQDSLSHEYNGQPYTLEVRLDTPNVYEITGNLPTQTNIGSYHTTYTLKDSTNYEVYDDALYTGETFDWEITKINFEDGNFAEKTYTYNGQSTTDTNAIYYAPGQKSVRIHLGYYSQYALLKTLVPTAHIEWSIADARDVLGAQLTQDGDDVVLTFTGLNSDFSTIDLNVTIAATAYSNAYASENPVQLTIYKREYSDEELAAITGTFFDMTTDEYENKYFSAHNKLEISQVTKLVPATANPANDPSVTTTLGAWKLYYYDGTNYIEVTPGTTVLTTWEYLWTYEFVPADDMYIGFMASVEVEYYKEDLSASVQSALATEYGTIGTLNLYTRTDCIEIPQYLLPTHGDPENFDGIDGTWVLLYDYENEQGETCTMSVSNNNLLYYTDTYAVRSRDYMANPARNWRIAFVPTNDAYNTFVLGAVNVVVPELPQA